MQNITAYISLVTHRLSVHDTRSYSSINLSINSLPMPFPSYPGAKIGSLFPMYACKQPLPLPQMGITITHYFPFFLIHKIGKRTTAIGLPYPSL